MNNEIAKIKQLFPKLIVTRVIDYNDLFYVVEAVKSLNESNYNDPYYAVDKKTHEIRGFIPSLDLDGFFDAMDNRTIYSIDSQR